MPQAKFTNFASSVIADVGGISAAATAVNLLAGDGAKFPALSGGDWFYAVLFQKSGAAEINHEVVKVTARAGDALTIVRGQDGTTAKAFVLGDSIELRWISTCVDDERALNDLKNAALAASIASIASGARFQRFTESGIWTCPADITSVMVDGCGGGGSGGAGGDGFDGSAGGGGGAGGNGARSTEVLTVVPGTEYAITVGAAGGASSFGVLKTWPAGSNGSAGGNWLSPRGGKGGASGAGSVCGQDGSNFSGSLGGQGGNGGGLGGASGGAAGSPAVANTGLGGGGGAGGDGALSTSGGAGGAGGSGFLNIWW